MSYNGRARVSLRRPLAQAVCDRCEERYLLDELQPQFEWAGPALRDTGYLVCRRCLDVPQDQFRTLILPQDPVPRMNPRSDFWTTPWSFGPPGVPTSPTTYGFSQYTLGLVESPADAPINAFLVDNYRDQLADGRWRRIYVQIGTATAQPGAAADRIYPTTKAGVLASIAAVADIPTPTQVFDRSLDIVPNKTMACMLEQPARNWIVLYNPTQTQIQISLSGPAFWGVTTNLILGPGEAYFWSTDQGLGAAYQGSINVIGLLGGVPFWAWESGGDTLWLTDDYGNLITDDAGRAIPLV
jgi:hypothetical protein